MTRNKFSIVLVTIATLTLSVAGYAAEYNFYDRAKEQGCASIITDSGVSDCKVIQKAKDTACNVALECDANKQEQTIQKYNEAKTLLASNKLNDSDRANLQRTVDTLKTNLDDRKAAAGSSTALAEGCVTARENVQKWFMEVGIPLTEKVRDTALGIRKDLLEKLAEAQRQQADAAAKRAANPNDTAIQANYDHATQVMRDAEKALEEFNTKYSKDIEYYASRLIEGYHSQKAAHEKPLDEAKNRRDNCKKLVAMSY